MSHEATDKELEQFWGTPVSESQWAEATERQTRGYDEDDLADAVYENSAILLAALAAGDLKKVGAVLAAERTKTITRRVNVELTGETGKTKLPLNPYFQNVGEMLAGLTIRGEKA
jgi:hypothetical protein